MMLHKMGWLFQKVLYPSLTWRRDTAGDKTIYLTFDDGPIPEMTPDILEILKAFKAKATFFCVGDNIRKYPEIFMRTQEEGHSIGNHTYNHINGWKSKDANYLENIALCTSAIQENTIFNLPKRILFRPPYGRISYSQISKVKVQYEIIMWEVLSGDFSASIDPETCLLKTIQNTRPGAIVVFHDNLKAQKNLDFVLPRYLEHCSQQGYTFKSL